KTAAAITSSIAVSSPRELGWRPAQTVFRGYGAGDRPRVRRIWTDVAMRPPGAALQARRMCSVVRVDGRDGPVEVLIWIASKLKLPVTENADLLVFRRPQGRSFAGRIVVPRRCARNPDPPGGAASGMGGADAPAALVGRARTRGG